MKKLIIIVPLIFFICSLIFHLWVRKSIKPFVEKNYETLYQKNWDKKNLAEWDFKFSMYEYPPGEVESIIVDSLNISKQEFQFRKIEKISNFILNKTQGRFGKPDFELLKNKSPYQQLELIENDKSKIWCGLFSFYYSYFLNHAGIASRYVSIEKPGDTIIGTHVITEILLPEERKWIYSDLTYDIIYVKNSVGLLNLVELVSAIKENDKTLVFFKNEINNGLSEKSIHEMDKDYINFMQSFNEIRFFTGKQLRNNFIPFTFSRKISENISPSSSYYLYGNENNDFNYMLFKGSRLLLIISFLIFSIVLFYKLSTEFFFRQKRS